MTSRLKVTVIAGTSGKSIKVTVIVTRCYPTIALSFVSATIVQRSVSTKLLGGGTT